MPDVRSRTFVLIPGAWHGAWCWQRLTPLLESAGHRVLAPELPGTGVDATAPATITLDTWAHFVADLVTQNEPVVLVGHSRGGAVISRAAELVPGHIRQLVYLAAYLLPAGASVASAARADPGSLVPANMVPAASGITCTLRAEVTRDALYGDCDEETFRFARDRLTPEPLKPLVTPLQLTSAGFGSVPRAYILCTRDRTISLAAQRNMLQTLPCHPVFEMDSDHSPFLSHAQQLAQLLGGL